MYFQLGIRVSDSMIKIKPTHQENKANFCGYVYSLKKDQFYVENSGNLFIFKMFVFNWPYFNKK